MNTKRDRLKLLVGLGAIGIGVAGARFYSTRPRPPAGSPMQVGYGDLPPGGLRVVEWEGHTIFVLHRAPADVAALAAREAELIDPLSEHSLQPDGCRNRHRSLLPELFVAVGQCTHQGCIPTLAPGAGGEGGFLCPCHTSRYDLAGRVFRGGPAPANLTVPEYRLAGNGVLVIGES